MHDYLAQEILKEQHEQTTLLRKILKVLQHSNFHNVVRGVLTQGDPMSPIVPGSSHSFTLTVEPAGSTFIPTDSTWTSSDPVNAPVTVDATGLVATVDVPATAPVGAEFTLTWSYSNADGTTATNSISATVVAPVVDVTGGQIVETT